MNNEQTKYLFKELDFIDTSISRLDNQIQKSKHFCILLWLGVLGFLVSDTVANLNNSQVKNALFLTVLIPLLFGIMDFHWRRALLMVSWRQLMISLFITHHDETLKKDFGLFPVLDPTGNNYDEKHYPPCITNLDQYKTKPTPWEVILYKEAKWFFPTMMLFSIIIGALYA